MNDSQPHSSQLARVMPLWLSAAASGRQMDPMLEKYGFPWRGKVSGDVSEALTNQARCLGLSRFAALAVTRDLVLSEVEGCRFDLVGSEVDADWIDVQLLRLADDVFRKGLDLGLADVDLYHEQPTAFGWWCFNTMVLACTVSKVEATLKDPRWCGSQGLIKEIRLNSVMLLRSRCYQLRMRMGEGPRSWHFDPPKRLNEILYREN